MKKFLVFAFILCSIRGSAQQGIQHFVDSLANRYLLHHPGALTIGINDNGKTKYFYYGETVKGNHQLPDSNSIFEIGSITETFTCILFADLTTKGFIGMDDPLQKFLPVQVPSPVYQKMVCRPSDKTSDPNPLPSNQEAFMKVLYTPYTCVPDSSVKPQPILLCYLATHTSGLPEFPGNLNRKKNKDNPYSSYSINQLYDYLKDYHLENPIGFDYNYSSMGIALLGQVLSSKMKYRFDTLLTKRILVPLNMMNTCFSMSDSQKKNFLGGYDEKGNTAQHWTYDVMAPSGALCSTVSDMMKFLSANAGKNKTSFSDLLDFTHNPRLKLTGNKKADMEIALGWKVIPSGYEGKKIVFQSGKTGGYASYIGFIETSHTGVVILSSVSKEVNDIGFQILRALEKEKL
jgi:D-alanyl-D-alanine-carboxypeptidase/D-alanyl-D-alanine-endopeptidase